MELVAGLPSTAAAVARLVRADLKSLGAESVRVVGHNRVRAMFGTAERAADVAALVNDTIAGTTILIAPKANKATGLVDKMMLIRQLRNVEDARLQAWVDREQIVIYASSEQRAEDLRTLLRLQDVWKTPDIVVRRSA